MPGIEELLAGRTLVKRYRIIEVIGRGGFAAVYRAADERLGRDVAVKVITYPAPDEATLQELRARFQREARAVASLPQHPNAVTVHDFGTDPELGLDFLVMELLPGEDLATYLAGHDCPPQHEAMGILRAAVEGVAVGHRVGLVHRDVKPGNIFLARTREQDIPRVCVLDFGIARVVADEGHTQLTRGSVPHSPAYASPEQLRGEPDLTAASDVFSLGVVGYQLLSGKKPFGDDRRAGAPEGSVPLRPLRELKPEVPAALAAVIERAMSVDAAERYPTAEAMADALDAGASDMDDGTLVAAPIAVPPPPDDATLLAAEPVPAPPPRREPVPAPAAAPPAAAPASAAPSGRSGRGMWVAVVLLALLAAGGVIWASSRGGGDEAEETAEVPLVVDPETGETGPVVTGEIIEPESPSGGDLPPSQPVPAGDPLPAPPVSGDPGTALPPATGAPVVLPPSGGNPAAPRPGAVRPVPTQPAPARPAQPARPDTAARDSARPAPRLLGDPIRRDTTRRDTSSAPPRGSARLLKPATSDDSADASARLPEPRTRALP